jgi:LPS O-antigen subunit length determinant protein (WzzB/FepE family)
LKADTIIMRRVSAGFEAPLPYALMPVDEVGAALLGKISCGDEVAVKIMRDRSLPQHRLFWSVLRYVAEASEWETAEKLLVALKLRLGRYDLMKLPSGKVVPVPDSISFAAMTQDDFQQFMDRSIAIICTEVLPGMDSDRLIAEADGSRPDMVRASLEDSP